MKIPEHTTEDFLRERLASIAPPRTLFEFVTKTEQHRQTSKSLHKDLSYLISPLFFMNKPLIVGVVVVVAAASIIGGTVLMGSGTSSVVATTEPAAVQPTATTEPASTPAVTADPTPTQVAESAPAVAVSPADSRASVDVLASEVANSETIDATAMAADSGDEAMVTADLNNYSDAKTSSYDNTI